MWHPSSSIIQTSLMKKFIVSIISMNLNNSNAKKKFEASARAIKGLSQISISYKI